MECTFTPLFHAPEIFMTAPATGRESSIPGCARRRRGMSSPTSGSALVKACLEALARCWIEPCRNARDEFRVPRRIGWNRECARWTEALSRAALDWGSAMISSPCSSFSGESRRYQRVEPARLFHHVDDHLDRPELLSHCRDFRVSTTRPVRRSMSEERCGDPHIEGGGGN